MKKELVFLWINKDEYGCFYHQEFNFSPVYRYSFDYQSKSLHRRVLDNINIFKNDVICNISSIVGENGTGKSTLLNFISTLSNLPIYEEKDYKYIKHNRRKQEIKKYVAVFIVGGKEKIINLLGEDIEFNGKIYDKHTCFNYEENFFDDITRINISNSEYNNKIDYFEEDRNSFLLNNNELNAISKNFYRQILRLNDDYGYDDKFYNLQEIILNSRTNKHFQQILDIMFYEYCIKNNKTFLGKKIKKVKFNFNYADSVVERVTGKRHSNKKLNQILDKLEDRLANKTDVNLIHSAIISNLVFELAYCYGFNLPDRVNTIENVFDECVIFIESEKFNKSQYYYFRTAIDEILSLQQIINERISDNLLPVTDPRYRQYCVVSVEKLAELIIRCYRSKHGSFILKYLNIFDLEMSSGERAMLNLMSRIVSLEYISAYPNLVNPKLNKNILLLIDEVDLYMHPNWQKKLVSVLIDQLDELFKGKNIQIILTTHSPIVLSDIPREHCIYLSKASKKYVVEDGLSHVQTFAAHINVLYKDSFFIEDGIGIGEFAIKKINSEFSRLKNNISNEINKNEYEKFIRLVGEPIIQRQLESYLKKNTISKYNKINNLDYNERKELLEFLHRQKNAIEKQIALLSGDNYD